MTRQPRPRLRAGWKLAPVLAVAAAAAVAGVPQAAPHRAAAELRAHRQLRHPRRRLRDAVGGGSATARFTDGTSIAVGARSVARVKARTRKGATIQLDRGRASFAVVHRPGADWHVEVGPYEIAVTGTEFDVRWSDNRDALRGGDEVGQHRRARLADGRRHPAARRPAAGGVADGEDAGRQRDRVRADRRSSRRPAPPEPVAPRDETPREAPPARATRARGRARRRPRPSRRAARRCLRWRRRRSSRRRCRRRAARRRPCPKPRRRRRSPT